MVYFVFIIKYIKFERNAANTGTAAFGINNIELINHLLEQQVSVIFCQSSNWLIKDLFQFHIEIHC